MFMFINYYLGMSDQLGLTEGYRARTRLGTPGLSASSDIWLTSRLLSDLVEPLSYRLFVDVTLRQDPCLQQRDVAVLEVDDDGVCDVLTLFGIHCHHCRQTPLCAVHSVIRHKLGLGCEKYNEIAAVETHSWNLVVFGNVIFSQFVESQRLVNHVHA